LNDDNRLQVTGYGLQVTGCRLRVAGFLNLINYKILKDEKF